MWLFNQFQDHFLVIVGVKRLVNISEQLENLGPTKFSVWDMLLMI